jgi:hypothetical protein
MHICVKVEIEGVRLGAPCTPAARAARALPSQAAVPQRSARVRRSAHRPCTCPNQSGPAPPYQAAASSRSCLTAGQPPTAWAAVLLKPPKRPCQGRALFQALHSQPHSAQACLSRHPAAARASPPPSRGPAKQSRHCGCMAGGLGGAHSLAGCTPVRSIHSHSHIHSQAGPQSVCLPLAAPAPAARALLLRPPRRRRRASPPSATTGRACHGHRRWAIDPHRHKRLQDWQGRAAAGRAAAAARARMPTADVERGARRRARW